MNESKWVEFTTDLWVLTEDAYLLCVQRQDPGDWSWEAHHRNHPVRAGESLTRRAAMAKAKKTMRWHRSGYLK